MDVAAVAMLFSTGVSFLANLTRLSNNTELTLTPSLALVTLQTFCLLFALPSTSPRGADIERHCLFGVGLVELLPLSPPPREADLARSLLEDDGVEILSLSPPPPRDADLVRSLLEDDVVELLPLTRGVVDRTTRSFADDDDDGV